MTEYHNKKEIDKISKLIYSILPDCCGVTLGGSRGYEVNDSISDVELYFYVKNTLPKLEDLDKCLNSIGAKHQRSPEFLWNELPWGPHSFFEVYGVTFEIGYRIVDEVIKQIDDYLDGDVAVKLDCHDLSQGYMRSGLLSSIINEKILISKDNSIEKLKEKSKKFPKKLEKHLIEEYLFNAKKLIDGKVLSAASRNDVIFFENICNRVVRDLIVMAFAVEKKHFPGDKWNEILILRGNWDKKYIFIKKIKDFYFYRGVPEVTLLNRRNFLLEAYNLIIESLKLNIR